MATFVIQHSWKRFQATVVNVESDAFHMYLADDTPATGDDVKADTTPITEQFGYTEYVMGTAGVLGWFDGTTFWSLRNTADKTWTASGGSFGPFKYVWIFDDTPNATPTDPLVGYWDVGAETTITTGNSFLVDPDANFAIYDLS